MELSKIHIKNFRSIKDEQIKFNHNCLVLLGKNEAGKSNILKAIAAVFGKYPVGNKDKRKKIDNEKIQQDEYFVRAIVSLTQEDINEIENSLKSKFQGVENISFKNGMSLNEFIKQTYRDFLITLKINDNSKPVFTHWKYNPKDIELNENFSVLATSIVLGLDTGNKFEITTETFKIVKELYQKKPIECHYWQYNDSFLLPSAVNITEFKTNPSSFKALENIFQLCGRENIVGEFNNAILEDGDYFNLFEQVSKQVTTTFQRIWADFKGVSIHLSPDGERILIKIAERAKYNCEDRSDGFKKFISILLMLSTQSRANKIIENDLILIDEPDQSLYPTSAQFLRDELLEIAKKSKIIYSTHSQYMIDPNTLDRHIVVEKKSDVTKLYVENINAPYTRDELLKRAIGSSIFECLKPINIIFEGYLDKKIFDLYCSFNKKENEFKDFGKIYSQGISGVGTIVSILDAANKKFIIVADSDSASESKRIDFKNDHPDYASKWLAYADIVSTVSTMEDFLEQSYLESEIHKFNESYVYVNNKNVIFNIEKAIEKDKDKKQAIKNNLMSNLKKDDVKEDYAKFLIELKKQLDDL